MISIIIFILTTFSGMAAGAYFSGRLSERCSVLNSYISLIQSMISYINFSGYKLAEVFTAVKKNTHCCISDKLVAISENGGDISEEWKACISESGYMKEEDRQILYELGGNIGKSNTVGETAVLELAKERLSFQLATAEEERKRKGRLYLTLGIMLGAAVGIMLI